MPQILPPTMPGSASPPFIVHTLRKACTASAIRCKPSSATPFLQYPLSQDGARATAASASSRAFSNRLALVWASARLDRRARMTEELGCRSMASSYLPVFEGPRSSQEFECCHRAVIQPAARPSNPSHCTHILAWRMLLADCRLSRLHPLAFLDVQLSAACRLTRHGVKHGVSGCCHQHARWRR